MAMKTLCVGCGNLPEGDVNVDAYPNDLTQCAIHYNPKTFRNFFVADMGKLPFKDKVFGEVIARHVLEHIPNPLFTLQELERVCKGKVYIYIPSPYVKDLTTTHLYAWDRHTLRNLMLKVFPKVEVKFTSRIYEYMEKAHFKTVAVNLVSKLFGFFTEIEAIGYC